MAVPFRKVSNTRGRKRRTHYKISVPGMVVCSNCGELKLSHRVCPVCGFYNGKLVKEVKPSCLISTAVCSDLHYAIYNKMQNKIPLKNKHCKATNLNF